ncbi:MAG: DHH family phosphoesterase, partial [Candidatus Roizmanbacteria bacterium]|nr:DHH family phosphoesterase [Candidatus Roizmanbacteria bacterium]
MQITFKHEIKLKDKITDQEIVTLLLESRNIKDLDEFLSPPSPLLLTLKDFGSYERPFKKVIKILKEIKEKNQMIVVYTDYDADGITGGAILWETLHLLGFKVMPYVPNRKLEGYGFSKIGIDNVKSKYDPALIISVDHGITKVDEIKYAKKLGIKIIITDHHLKGDKIPESSEAIFHIPALSGSGVSYFFAKEIFNSFSTSAVEERSGKTAEVYKVLANNFITDYAALASIGTIADLVPLVGPSRSLVKYGLENFNKVKRFGIKHILKQAGIADKKISPYEVGFMIAPRINAIGRLEHAIDALRLLCTNDEKKAYDLSHKIGNINVERQELVERSVKEAKIMLAKTSAVKNQQDKEQTSEVNIMAKIIILVSDHWNEG